MLKKTIIHLAIAGLIFLIGVLFQEFHISEIIGVSLVFIGMGYGLVWIAVPTIKILSEALQKREKNNLYTELVTLKKLLDDGILTQEEFDARSAGIKSKLL